MRLQDESALGILSRMALHAVFLEERFDCGEVARHQERQRERGEECETDRELPHGING